MAINDSQYNSDGCMFPELDVRCKVDTSITMTLLSLIYVSSAVKSLKQSDIVDILRVSRSANAKRDITGILLFKDGNFMQILEGEAANVEELYQKLSKDKRHTGLITLRRMTISTRSFGEWKMGFRDVHGLTDEELIGRSDYLEKSFNDPSYINSPNAAFRLLESFKKIVK